MARQTLSNKSLSTCSSSRIFLERRQMSLIGVWHKSSWLLSKQKPLSALSDAKVLEAHKCLHVLFRCYNNVFYNQLKREFRGRVCLYLIKMNGIFSITVKGSLPLVSLPLVSPVSPSFSPLGNSSTSISRIFSTSMKNGNSV